MQEQFYVSHNGAQMGPLSVEQIVEKMRANELGAADFLYDESKGDWILLMEHQAVAQQISTQAQAKPAKPAKLPPKAANVENGAKSNNVEAKVANSDGREWFVLKGDNKFGPFAFLDLVRMLQEKVIFEFDYVWNSELANWARIAEMEEFNSERIKDLALSKKIEVGNIFFRRRHRRVRFGGSIIVHDNKNVWKGQTLEISEGGAGIIMDNSMILPGQTLYLHFKPGDGVPPFNAVCEVVSKKYVDRVAHKDTPIRYGVKFVSISSTAQRSIQDYSEKNKEGSAA